jgi:hypothetical protein
MMQSDALSGSNSPPPALGKLWSSLSLTTLSDSRTQTRNQLFLGEMFCPSFWLIVFFSNLHFLIDEFAERVKKLLNW